MWKLPLLEASTKVVQATVDTDIVAVFQDSKKKAIVPSGSYSNLIEKLEKKKVFSGKVSTQEFVRFVSSSKAENVLFCGLGLKSSLTEDKMRDIGGSVWMKLVHAKVQTGVIQVSSFDASPKMMRAFAEGLILGIYHLDREKKDKKGSDPTYLGPESLIFLTRDKSAQDHLEIELKQVRAVGDAVRVTREWSNLPSNIGTPAYYAQQALKLAGQYKLKCKVIGEQEALREKMGLFLGVGKGAERENKFVVMEYVPKKAKKYKTIVLVGKGVTFDSGGISIKPSMRMEDMKHDMTGAATVMGATLLAASWEVPHRIVTIMPFTENMPDGDAIQPGNVLTARNGKTVEIINTDAEGRLILADALDYAQDYNPDVIVDVATLTGAVGVALGKLCCAVLGNDAEINENLKKAAQVHGERIWELPLYDEYMEDLKSDYADMKNATSDGYAGTIRGAIFLKQFIRKDIRWAHLDIAATAYNVSHLSYIPKRGASGMYVRALAQFVSDF